MVEINVYGIIYIICVWWKSNYNIEDIKYVFEMIIWFDVMCDFFDFIIKDMFL